VVSGPTDFGEENVEEDEVESFLSEKPEGFPAISSDRHIIAPRLQGGLEGLANRGFIVHDEDTLGQWAVELDGDLVLDEEPPELRARDAVTSAGDAVGLELAGPNSMKSIPCSVPAAGAR